FLRHTVLPSFIDIFQMSDESSSTILFSIYIIEWIYKLLLSTIALLFAGSMLWKFIRKQLSMEEKIKVYNLIPVYRQYLKLKTSLLFWENKKSCLFYRIIHSKCQMSCLREYILLVY